MRFVNNLTGDIAVINKQGRVIGHLKPSDVPAFKSGATALLVPVHNWRTTFSVGLMRRLGLPVPRSQMGGHSV